MRRLPRLSERDRCVFDLASHGLSAPTIAALLRLAPKAKRYAEAQCNGRWPDGTEFINFESAEERRPDERTIANPDRHQLPFRRAVERVATMLKFDGVGTAWSMVSTEDPRGFTLRVTHPSLRGNTMGGTNDSDEYGIHGS